MIFILFFFLIILTIFIDQLTKYWVRIHLKKGETMEIWEGVLNLTHIKNSGAVFGIFKGYGRLFVPIAVIVTIGSFYMYLNGDLNGVLMKVGVAFFVGGAIGNAIDRTLFNQVTDFIHFKFSRTIFNFADLFLVKGIILIFIGSYIINI